MEGGYIFKSKILDFVKNKNIIVKNDLFYTRDNVKYEPTKGSLDNHYNLKHLLFNYPITKFTQFGAVKLKTFNNKNIDANIAIILQDEEKKYICISSTFISMDGEYRPFLLPFDYFEKQILKYKSQLNSVIDFLLKYQMPIKLKTYNTDIDPFIVLAIYYFINMTAVINHNSSHSLIKIMKHIMNDNIKSFIANDELVMIVNIFTRKTKELTKINNLYIKPSVGIKLLSMEIESLRNIGDIRYNIWLELYINNILTNILINGISDGFPITFNYSLLNSKKYNKLYDLKISKMKFEQSDKMKKLNKLIDKSSNMGFNEKIDQLKKSLDNDFINIKHLSDKSLVIFMNHSGPTLDNMLSVILDSENINRFKSMNPTLFASKEFLFKVIYNLHIMNKYNILHGDLHLNNVTIKVQITDVKVQYHMYTINNNNYYIHDKFSPIIIDFSRCIIGSKIIEQFDYKEQLYSTNRNKMRNMWKQLMPKFYEKNKDKINHMIMHEYDKMFNIMSALDIYRFTLLLKSKYNDSKYDIVDNAPFKTLLNLYHAAEDEIQKLNGNSLLNLFKLFKEFKTVPDNGIVIDIFNDSNELKYSMNDYDSLPPMSKIASEEELNNEDDILDTEVAKDYLVDEKTYDPNNMAHNINDLFNYM